MLIVTACTKIKILIWDMSSDSDKLDYNLF